MVKSISISKIHLLLILLVLGFIVYQEITKDNFQTKLKKEVEANLKIEMDQLKQSFELQKGILSEMQFNNLEVSKKLKDNNDKLKADEKAIYNTDVDSIRRENFKSKHRKRVRK